MNRRAVGCWEWKGPVLPSKLLRKSFGDSSSEMPFFFFYGHTCNFVSIDQVNDKRLISTPSHTDDQNAQFLLVLLAQRVVSRGLKTNSLLFTTITSKNIRTHEVQ